MRRATDNAPNENLLPPSPNSTGRSNENASVGTPFRVKQLAAQSRQRTAALGRRTRTIDTPRGHVIGSAIPTQPIKRFGDIALLPTLQAAAVNRYPLSVPNLRNGRGNRRQG